MVDELGRDLANDLERTYENFRFYNGRAESILYHINKAEEEDEPLPDIVPEYDSDPRELVEENLDNALNELENALDLVQQNIIHLEEDKYDSSVKLSEFVQELDSETYLDFEPLHEEIDNYKSTVDFADLHQVDLDNRHFQFHYGGEVVESNQEYITAS